MFIEERHQAILKVIQENGRISIGEIQEKFGVSVDSARRDLRLLEERGLLKRTHGGAIPLVQVGVLPPRLTDMKSMEVYDNFAAIAQKAAAFVRENDTVYLTSGTLGYIVLKYLRRDIPYTLVLNSVTLAEEVKYWDNITVYITGGRMRMSGASPILDSLATAFVKNMHFDLCLMTGAGCNTAFGFSNSTDEGAAFQRAVLKNSRRKILMMPSHKIGFEAFIKVCDADVFGTLITDWDAAEDERNKIEDAGVQVLVADKP